MVPKLLDQLIPLLAGTILLLSKTLVDSNPNPEPLFLRGQLGGLFRRNNANNNNDRSSSSSEITSRYGAGHSGGGGDRYANGAGYHNGGRDRYANAAGFVSGNHGGGYSGGGTPNRGGGYQGGGNRYGDHHGSGYVGGNQGGYGQGHYGHGGGGGNYGHGGGGGVEYNGGGLGGGGGTNQNQPTGLYAGLKSLLFGMHGRMKNAYLAMKHALKAMFYRGELGGNNNNNNNGNQYGNNYAGNYGYDRSSGGQKKDTIELKRTGTTELKINLPQFQQSSHGGWPKWLRFLG